MLIVNHDHTTYIPLHKVKESQHWGETPEQESYLEEQAKEYLLDKARESLQE